MALVVLLVSVDYLSVVAADVMDQRVDQTVVVGFGDRNHDCLGHGVGGHEVETVSGAVWREGNIGNSGFGCGEWGCRGGDDQDKEGYGGQGQHCQGGDASPSGHGLA